jgi:hypothetical protein
MNIFSKIKYSVLKSKYKNITCIPDDRINIEWVMRSTQNQLVISMRLDGGYLQEIIILDAEGIFSVRRPCAGPEFYGVFESFAKLEIVTGRGGETEVVFAKHKEGLSE